MESIRLSLEKSGYRNPDTHDLTLNVDYADTHQKINKRLKEIYAQITQGIMERQPGADRSGIIKTLYEQLDNNAEVRALAHSFEVVIIASEIVSVAPFDPDIFKTYFEKDQKKANV